MGPDSTAIPPELTGPTPRRTRLTGNGLRMAIGALIFLSFGIGLAVPEATHIAHQIQYRATLRRENREVVGEVTREGKGNTVYYSFAVNGATFTNNVRAPRQQWIDLGVNDPIPIRYLSTNPAINYPAQWEWSVSLEWNPLLAIAVWIFVSSVFFLSLHSDRKLVAEGTPAVGLVTKCSPWSRGGFIVRYEFHTADGTLMRGKGWPQTSYKIGADICVLYLSQRPKRNKSYPMNYYRIAE